jgi:hypothetical protein
MTLKEEVIDELEQGKIPQKRKIPVFPDDADFLFKYYQLYDFISESENLLMTGIAYSREVKEIELYQQALKNVQILIKKRYDELENKKFWIKQQLKNNKKG